MANHTDKALESKAKQFLKKNFLSTTKIDEKDMTLLLDKFELATFKKNQIIVNEGDIQEYFYFIYKGIIRIYFYKNKKMVIERFAKEGGFFGSSFSHITNKPGFHIYEALEDLVVLRIRYSDLNILCRHSHEIERLYRMSLELLFSYYINKFYAFAALTSNERYHQFMNDFGDITNRIPLKYIANYLGMTSETLSRIRAKYDRMIREAY
jgi:CRP-like cAMP-binding protein